MRRVLAETGLARTGKIVRVSLALPKDMDYGRIYVWARGVNDEDFSPYIDERLLDVVSADGRPQMHKPLSFVLHERRRHLTHEFVSETSQNFRLVQEIDSHSEPKVKARIKVYGKIAEALRRFLRNCIRLVRR